MGKKVVKCWSVYSLNCPIENIVRYIGITKQDPIRKRLLGHLQEAKRHSKWKLITSASEKQKKSRWKCSNVHKTSWIIRLRDAGQVPKVKVEFCNLSKKKACRKEKELIEYYRKKYIRKFPDKKKLTNILDGGTMPPIYYGDKHPMKQQINREKISGKNHPMFNKKHSKETKRKMSISRLGKRHSVETKIKIGISNSGSRNGMHGRSGPKHHNTVIRQFKVWSEEKEVEYYFDYQLEAAKNLNINNKHISKVLLGKGKTTHGFYMCYVDELNDWSPAHASRKTPTGAAHSHAKKRAFILWNDLTKEKYKFNFVFEAVRKLGVKSCRITEILNGTKKSYKGYKASFT